jgi:hypothetical protein
VLLASKLEARLSCEKILDQLGANLLVLISATEPPLLRISGHVLLTRGDHAQTRGCLFGTAY